MDFVTNKAHSSSKSKKYFYIIKIERIVREKIYTKFTFLKKQDDSKRVGDALNMQRGLWAMRKLLIALKPEGQIIPKNGKLGISTDSQISK